MKKDNIKPQSTYMVKITMSITTKDDYHEKTIAESNVSQAITCNAIDVRKQATKLVHTAVTNMGESAAGGLACIIEKEGIQIESSTEKTLEI